MNCAVIFGGAGFIGIHFAELLILNSYTEKVYLFDIESIEDKNSSYRSKIIKKNPNIVMVIGDIRNSLDWFRPSEEVKMIANFAAIHREPGHEDIEFYRTNLVGAENVCDWARFVGCNKIIFTSSISTYGVGESTKDEATLPIPVTPYGGSKLVAEKIHLIWQAQDEINRRLVIVRPGVVFGPSEGGNVSRLIKAVIHRYFFYMGNKNTRKAGTYVKELCNAMCWVLERQIFSDERVSLFNMSMIPNPSIQDYVNTVCATAGVRRYIPSVPFRFLLMISYLISALATPFATKHPFSPVRIRKLVRSNDINTKYLISNGYNYKYDLESALADWHSSNPQEWI